MEDDLKQKLIKTLEAVETPSPLSHKHVSQDIALLKKPDYIIPEDKNGLDDVYEYLRILFCENEELMTDNNKKILLEFSEVVEMHHKPRSGS